MHGERAPVGVKRLGGGVGAHDQGHVAVRVTEDLSSIDAARIAAPIGDHHARADLGAGENVPRGDDPYRRGRKRRPVGLGARGDDDQIRRECDDLVNGGLVAETQAEVRRGQRLGEVGQESIGELSLTGSDARDRDLPPGGHRFEPSLAQPSLDATGAIHPRRGHLIGPAPKAHASYARSSQSK